MMTVSGRGEWRAGWTMLFASTIAYTLACIPLATVGALIKPLGDAFGWSRAEMSAAILLTAFGTLTLSPFVGPLVDRIGPRKVALGGTIAVGIGTISIGLSGPSILSWYAAWALYAVTQCFANGVIWANGVISRFERNRGAALAVFLTLQALCFGIVPMVALAILDNLGWRWIYFSIGLSSLLIGWPLTWRLFFAARDLDPAATAPAPRERGRFTTLLTALKTRIFWQIGMSFSIAAACVGAAFIHLQPVLIDAGISPARAAAAIFMVGPASVVGRLLTGILLDRYQPQLISAAALLFPAMAYAMLLFLAKTEASAIVVALFIGLAAGAETDLLAYVVSRYFRTGSFSSIYAPLLGIYGVGYGLAPVLAGAMFDRTESYAVVFGALMVAAVIGAVLMITLGKPAADPPV